MGLVYVFDVGSYLNNVVPVPEESKSIMKAELPAELISSALIYLSVYDLPSVNSLDDITDLSVALNTMSL